MIFILYKMILFSGKTEILVFVTGCDFMSGCQIDSFYPGVYNYSL